MQKKGFTIIEVVIAFLLILAVTFLVLPMSLDNTKQAGLISHWSELYSRMEYMFSVIKAQENGNIEKGFLNGDSEKSRTKVVVDAIKPYLRIKSEVTNQKYKQFYKSNLEVRNFDKYYFDKFYTMDSGEIVGIKWFKKDLKNPVRGLLAFDLNGEEKPNTWGEDIFGINVLENSIEPIGKNQDLSALKNDCSKFGLGIFCSYYYLIGGKFE